MATSALRESCTCQGTPNKAWGCGLWTDMKMLYSEAAVCNFVRLLPDSSCITHSQKWRQVSDLFSECCRNETNTAANIRMVGAISIENGPAANAHERYRQRLAAQSTQNISSKILFHAAKTNQDALSICKNQFTLPPPHVCNSSTCGNHISGVGIYSGQPKWVTSLVAQGGLAQGQRTPGNRILTQAHPLEMLMCDVIPGKSYLVTNRIDGSNLMNGYDSHVGVGEPPFERVVFDPDAILPIYIVEVISVPPGVSY